MTSVCFWLVLGHEIARERERERKGIFDVTPVVCPIRAGKYCAIRFGLGKELRVCRPVIPVWTLVVCGAVALTRKYNRAMTRAR